MRGELVVVRAASASPAVPRAATGSRHAAGSRAVAALIANSKTTAGRRCSRRPSEGATRKFNPVKLRDM
jgi:hypothetical protein